MPKALVLNFTVYFSSSHALAILQNKRNKNSVLKNFQKMMQWFVNLLKLAMAKQCSLPVKKKYHLHIELVPLNGENFLHRKDLLTEPRISSFPHSVTESSFGKNWSDHIIRHKNFDVLLSFSQQIFKKNQLRIIWNPSIQVFSKAFFVRKNQIFMRNSQKFTEKIFVQLHFYWFLWHNKAPLETIQLCREYFSIAFSIL